MKGHAMNSDKPGLKTSEFWAAMGSAFLAIVPALLAALNGHPAMGAVMSAVSLIAPVVYVWGRSILKAEQAKHTDVLSDKWERRLEAMLNVVEHIVAQERTR